MDKKFEAQCRELARKRKKEKEESFRNALNRSCKQSHAFFTKDRPMRRIGRPKKIK